MSHAGGGRPTQWTTSSSLLAPRLLILGAALLFSTGGAAIKACSLGHWQVAALRSGIAALALFVAFPSWRRFWSPSSLLVGTAYAATMIGYVAGNKLTTAANTIFLQSTAPVYLLLLGPWLLRERLRRQDLLFTAVLLGGMVLFFVGVDDPSATAPDPLTGNLVAAGTGLTWALTLTGIRWLGRERPIPGVDRSGTAVVAGNLIACLAALPFALPIPGAEARDWVVIAYLGVFQIGLAYVWMTRGVRRVAALEASLLLLLEPVANATWAWLVHGERPGAWSLAGCAVILLATGARTCVRNEI